MAKTRKDLTLEEIEKQRLREEKEREKKKQKEEKIPFNERLKNLEIDPSILADKKTNVVNEETPKEEVTPTRPEYIKDERGNITGLIMPDGNVYPDLPKETIDAILNKYDRTTPGIVEKGIQPAGTAQRQAELLAEGKRLSGQVGKFGELPVSPTGLDFGEAATQGIVGAIPRALSYAATGAAIGAVGGSAALGVGAAPGAAIGAVGGFVSGIAGSMISNFRSQRTDTTTAQQRVLDEGKQNLNDWATLAATDPANRALYIKNFNQQLALIDQAYRQMRLDTSRDVAKFETALPNLAEFEAFYMAQGERDFLTARMFEALQMQPDPEYVYQTQELAKRRTK